MELQRRCNPDDVQSWVKYRSGLCENCWAGCCTMPIEIRASDLVRLGLADEGEISEYPSRVARQLVKDGILKSYRERTGLFMIQPRPNGDCRFLDANSRRCSVYQIRPEMCRKFPTEIGNRPGFCPAGPK